MLKSLSLGSSLYSTSTKVLCLDLEVCHNFSQTFHVLTFTGRKLATQVVINYLSKCMLVLL
jgi:hypothetical protein